MYNKYMVIHAKMPFIYKTREHCVSQSQVKRILMRQRLILIRLFYALTPGNSRVVVNFSTALYSFLFAITIISKESAKKT